MTSRGAEEKLDELFGKGKWNSLTLQEYLILQRKEFEERQDHSFDVWSANPRESQATWLFDSKSPFLFFFSFFCGLASEVLPGRDQLD